VPTVIERINVSVDAGDLEARISVQVERLQQIVELVTGLIEAPPSQVGDFLDLAANLPVPELDVEGDFAAGLQAALGALPAELGDVTGAVSGDLGRFATLVEEQLQPLLQDAVRIAAAVERLMSLDFRCGHAGGPAAGGAGTGGDPAPASDNPGAERMASTAAQVQQVNDLLDRLPASPGPGGLLEFFFPIVDHKLRNKLFQVSVPLLDDVVEPLRTLSRWAAMTPAQVGLELEATIALLDLRLRAATLEPIDQLGTDLGALAPQLELPALAGFADAYGGALDDLVLALETADPPATVAPVAALNNALDEVAPTLASWDGGVAANLEGLRLRLKGMSDDLLDRITHLLTLLEPVELPSLAVAVAPAPRPPEAAAVAAVQEAVQPVLDWLNELVVLLDFSALQAEVSGISGQAQDLADGVQEGLTGVGLQVQSLFDDLGGHLAGLDLTAPEDQLNAQIQAFGAGLERSLSNGFDPAATTIADAVQALSDALDDFDPADVVAALQSVLQAITGVLESGEVQDAVRQVQSAVASVTETLQKLSFAPVTDEVVDLIAQMTKALQQLQDTDMNDAAKAALAVALQVLPDDLKPVTDPLVDELDELIETGPVPLLERVAEKPAQLLGAVTRFQPGTLIGDTLSAPFDQALSKADGFRPSSLLDQADAALQSAKSALLQSAGPGQVIGLLGGPFDDLKSALDRYSPDAVLAPLETAVEDAVRQVVAASPVDEIFDQVNRVFALIDAALDVPRNLVATMQRLHDLLQGFAESGQQIDAWRDGLLDKVLGVGNLGDIGNALSSLGDAVSASAHEALLSRYDSVTQDLVQALDDFAPGSRVAALVPIHNRARSLASGLADSAEKTAVLAALDRLDPGRVAPLRLSQQLAQALSQSRADLEAAAEDWQTLVEDPEGLLAEIAGLSADADGLRQLLAAAVEPPLAPLRYLFAVLEAAGPALAAMLETLQQLVDDLTDGVAGLLTGPGSLQGISDAVQQVVDTLRDIDLGFLRQGLQQLFLQLGDQLDAVNPARLADALDSAFADVLDGIDVAQVIAPATVAQLDADYAAALDKLRGLDPRVLITDLVQPEYEATVVPLVQAFDLTPAFNALIEFLRSLSDELSGELDRVNGAYQGLRAARPSLGGSIDVNISF
jgi:hypothetical protein